MLKTHSAVKHKPERRIIAETSVLNSITLLTTVAATQFIPVDDIDEAIKPPEDNRLAQEMHRYFVTKGSAGITHVAPELLINIDAQTLDVHTQRHENERFYISSIQSSGKFRAVFKPGVSSPDHAQWLMKIKGISAAGASLPFVVALKGLPESELPVQQVADGVYVAWVQGWGIGSGANPDVGGEGFAVFIRGDYEGALKRCQVMVQMAANGS